jgi:hypothetical protein
VRLANPTRNALADAFAGRCDGGTIQLRTGSPPTAITDTTGADVTVNSWTVTTPSE